MEVGYPASFPSTLRAPEAFQSRRQECFEAALDEIARCEGWTAPKHAMAQFWGAHQRFFRQLCMSIKVASRRQVGTGSAQGWEVCGDRAADHWRGAAEGVTRSG